MGDNGGREAVSGYGRAVVGDAEIRRAVHEMRKVREDVWDLVGRSPSSRRGGGEPSEDGLAALDAAERRYERVAEMVNKRVYGEVRAWMQAARDQGALVLALATSGVEVGEGWSPEDVARLRETGGYGRRKMVEVLEAVLMDLDGTVVFRQRVRPEFVPGGDLRGTEVHGLTLEDLAREPSFPVAARGIGEAAEGRRVIAYNAPWAVRVLAAECARWGVPDPVPGMGEDDCVMLQRSRFAGQYLVSVRDHKRLPLGAPDATPEGVARAVCDVVEAYRAGSAERPPESPYDPWAAGNRDYSLREHWYGWRDARKPEDHETDAERDERNEREEREEAERREARVAALVAGGMPEEEARREEASDFEDLPF